MHKRHFTLAFGLLAALLAAPFSRADASVSGINQPPPYLRKATSQQAKGKKVDVKKQYPMLKAMSKKVINSPFRIANKAAVRMPLKKGRAGIARAAGTGRELWGNVAYQTSWTETKQAHYGLYSFAASSPLQPELLFEQADLIASGGSALIDGVFHCMNLDTSWAGLGIIFLYHSTYDVETGEMITEPSQVSDLKMAALETAQDMSSGTVYGAFYTSDLSGYELGVVDYSSMSRTTIGSLTKAYVALGLSKDGKLYGVASDGNFYSIDKATAQETLIGATGLTLANSQGQYYGQSGEIDQATNTFYWAAIDINNNSALYTIDLTTGAASKIADFPESEQIYGMAIPSPAAADGAPAKAENLVADLPNGSTSGYLRFDVPTKTYGGQNLDPTTELNYKVLVNDVAKAEGTTLPGRNENVLLTDLPEGDAKFTVILSNSVGDGPKSNLTKYIGFDTPKPASNVNLTLNSETGKVNLTWDAPTEGVNGGYLGTLTYDVVRYPDNKKVMEASTSTSFSETLESSSMKAYSYGVTAINNGKKSQEAVSGSQVYGDAITPPYYEPFNTEASFNMFTVVNSNGDEKTWEYDDSKQSVVYRYSSDFAADDWLITPPLKLEKGKIYSVSYAANSYLSNYPERMEVKYGKAKDPAQLTEVLQEPQTLPEGKTSFQYDIIPSEDMEVYVGFHAMSDANMFRLYLDDIRVSEGRPTTVPGKPTDLKAVPGERGALYADVSFKAPSKDYAGNNLQGNMTKVELMRGDSIVKTFTNVTAGQALTFKDVYKESGDGTYSVLAYNDGGYGLTSDKVTVFVGEDVPEDPKNITATDNQTSVKLAWDKVSEVGVNGGYVNPSNVKYRIYDLVDGAYGTQAEFKDETASTSYDVAVNTTEGEQDLLQFGLDAYNATGESSILITPVVLTGKPYTLPFLESFPGGKLTYGLWWLSGDAGNSLDIAEDAASDGDGGSVSYVSATAEDSSYLCTGKIALANAEKPALSFKHNAAPGTNVAISVVITKPDGSEDEIEAFDYSKVNGEALWRTENIDLSAYKALPYIIVKFLFTAKEESAVLHLDEVSVRNMVDYDLAASIDAPESVNKGGTAAVTVKVTNHGTNPVSGYTVKLSANDKEVESKEVSETLESLASREFKFDYKASMFDEAEVATLKAEVVYQGDLDESNNAAKAEVKLVASKLPKPETVTATEAVGGVTVAWTMAENAAQTVTEDFESYPAWSIDNLGDWSMIDGDGGKAGSFFNGLSYQHQGEPFAYIVFNPENLYAGLTEQNPTWKPKSGEQFLLSVYQLNEAGDDYISNDDWLISPTLSGNAQTIKFWVSNLNEANKENAHTFDVLVSTTGKERADFVKVGETITQSSGEWTEVSVELPEGAKYFAINNFSDNNNSFGLFIDDITYEKGAPTVTGFNVYRDGEKLQSVAGDVKTFVDEKAPAGEHTYSVTALYAEGESAPTSATITTAIGEVEADGAQTYTVYSVDGRFVGKDIKSLKLLRPGVYIVNDKKVVVK